MTVKAITSGSDTVGYGFSSTLTNTGGGLAPLVFTIGQNDYTIDGLYVYDTNHATFPGDLLFDLTGNSVSGNLTTAESDVLQVHPCDTGPYAFLGGVAQYAGLTNGYLWTTTLDWSDPVTTRTVYLSLPANNAATGEPAITGTAQTGQELTADASPIMDADGLPSSFTYQWVRVDADGMSNPADITDATAATYPLTAADAGKKIKVQVSFTDELSGEEMRTSVMVTSTPHKTTVTVSEAVEVVGDPVFRFSLTNSGGAANDVPATYDRTRSSPTTMVFTYTVQAGDMDNNGIWIGDHSRTFMLDANDRIRTASQQIDIDRSHPEKGTHADHKVDGSRTPLATVPPDPTAPTLVLATATTLTIEWTHPGDGGSPLTRNFVHYRVEGTTDWTNWYAGETPVTRAVITNLQAETAYDVRVHSRNAIGNSQWVQSATAFSTLANTRATGAPTITGTAEVGQTLTAVTTGIMDADGLTSPTYTYQWIRVDGTEADIAAANSSTYTLVDADRRRTNEKDDFRVPGRHHADGGIRPGAGRRLVGHFHTRRYQWIRVRLPKWRR